jgi:putative solute:sodium symporter small subunit
MSDKQDKATAYWKENLRYLLILLSIWFAVSYGAGIIFKEALDSIKLGGFHLVLVLHNRVQFMYLSY